MKVNYIASIRAGRRLAAAVVVMAVVGLATDEPGPKPIDRSEATAIIADARKILTPNGVERLEKLRIGGIEQWVSVRGTDRTAVGGVSVTGIIPLMSPNSPTR